MHMLRWARSQKSFEFTRVLMNGLRKSGMWEDVQTMRQAQVKWSDPRTLVVCKHMHKLLCMCTCMLCQLV